jgi:hypothetical protein
MESSKVMILPRHASYLGQYGGVLDECGKWSAYVAQGYSTTVPLNLPTPAHPLDTRHSIDVLYKAGTYHTRRHPSHGNSEPYVHALASGIHRAMCFVRNPICSG